MAACQGKNNRGIACGRPVLKNGDSAYCHHHVSKVNHAELDMISDTEDPIVPVRRSDRPKPKKFRHPMIVASKKKRERSSTNKVEQPRAKRQRVEPPSVTPIVQVPQVQGSQNIKIQFGNLELTITNKQ